jgi:hypothetical protein
MLERFTATAEGLTSIAGKSFCYFQTTFLCVCNDKQRHPLALLLAYPIPDTKHFLASIVFNPTIHAQIANAIRYPREGTNIPTEKGWSNGAFEIKPSSDGWSKSAL